jgi:hypothetical protein
LLSAAIDASPEPNQYTVALSWTQAPAPGESWLLQRHDPAGTVRTLWRFDSDASGTRDTAVEPGSRYRYQIAAGQEGSWRVLDETDVTVPVDREIRGIQEIASLQVQRLFLRAGTVLRTAGKPVTITADQLLSEDARIETFAPGQQAPAQTDGRSGGTLTIRARTGAGLLTVVARGENGGPGRKGSAGAAGAAGPQGSPAVLELFNPELLNRLTHPVTVTYNGQMGAPQSPQMPTYSVGNAPPPAPLDPIWKAIYRCQTPPGAGLPGQIGGPGQDGIPGGKGGGSGDLTIAIQEPGPLRVATRLEPGQGGLGEGGDGGPRGPSGPAGALDEHRICGPAAEKPAPPGQGPRGRDRRAPSGAQGALCLRTPESVQGDCPGQLTPGH